MLTWIREKLGPLGIGLVIGLIALVFVFTGFFTPDPFYTGSAAGSVNGELISLGEFNRSLQQRMEFFKNLKLSPEQMKSFKIEETVFNDLVNRKLMVQRGREVGLVPSEKAVKKAVKEIPAFQKDGAFNFQQYREVLRANRYTPTGFEKLIQEDLIQQRWQDYFQTLVRVSDEEVKKEFISENEKRAIKFVLITNEMAKKGLNIGKKELTAYLKDEEKLKKVKDKFEMFKDSKYKGKDFDKVKSDLAREFILNEESGRVEKFVEETVSKIEKSMTASKAGDSKVNRILKPLGGKLETFDNLTFKTQSIPGLGEASDLMSDAMESEPSLSEKPKKYIVPRGTVVAMVTKVENANLAELNSDMRAEILDRLLQEKERALFESFVKDLRTQADEKGAIKMNRAALGLEEAAQS